MSYTKDRSWLSLKPPVVPRSILDGLAARPEMSFEVQAVTVAVAIAIVVVICTPAHPTVVDYTVDVVLELRETFLERY